MWACKDQFPLSLTLPSLAIGFITPFHQTSGNWNQQTQNSQLAPLEWNKMNWGLSKLLKDALVYGSRIFFLIIYKDASKLCGKYGQYEGPFYHAWWPWKTARKMWVQIPIPIQRILKTKIQQKPELFLLGLMNRKLEKKPQNDIFTYNHCCETTICPKMERLWYYHNWGMIGEDHVISRNAKINLFA